MLTWAGTIIPSEKIANIIPPSTPPILVIAKATKLAKKIVVTTETNVTITLFEK
jgi:hypothetical protein